MTAGATPDAARARGERGQTMFEVIAVVTILGIVLTMVYQGIDSAGQAIGGTEKRLANLDEARILMAVSTKDVRTATRLQAGTSPFTLADKRELIFYANLNNNGASGSVVDNGPRRVRIYVDTEQPAHRGGRRSPTRPRCRPRTRTTARRDPALRRPLRRERGEPADLPVLRHATATSSRATPLSATDRLAVNSVQITLSIRRSTTFPIANTTLVNTVRLPNVDYQETFGG